MKRPRGAEFWKVKRNAHGQTSNAEVTGKAELHRRPFRQLVILLQHHQGSGKLEIPLGDHYLVARGHVPRLDDRGFDVLEQTSEMSMRKLLDLKSA